MYVEYWAILVRVTCLDDTLVVYQFVLIYVLLIFFIEVVWFKFWYNN